ncbi:MAG: triose-phosphate isomerase [Nitrospinota bacterium]|nr:triose-phosphate isomerase [Nitrospinota bacterium]
MFSKKVCDPKDSMRRPIIAGNWKMNKTTAEAAVLVDEIKHKLTQPPTADIILAPPYTALGTVQKQLVDTPIALAGQNIHAESDGAFTGEISAPMLKEAGCAFVILGHSERRQAFTEDDSLINKKIKTAMGHGLKVIFCLGETLEMREQDKTIQVVGEQLNRGLEGLGNGELENLVIAYEPVWAIGTGKNASPEQAQEIHTFIRDHLDNTFGPQMGSSTRILYGGSVNSQNSADLLGQADIDGALVGGASLIADAFCAIIESVKPSDPG